MLKATHIKIANNILESIQSNIDWKINKLAYLFGSFAPDLNCAFPTHTFDHTYNRFIKRIKRIDNSESNIIKSFTLGVLLHYICDYFCYAHNLKHNNPKHAIYERCLRSHIKRHYDDLEVENKELQEQINKHWEYINNHLMQEIEKVNTEDELEQAIKRISVNGLDHIDYIMSSLEYMHNAYMDETEQIKDTKWYKSNEKIELDISYSKFMCQKLALIILNPGLEFDDSNLVKNF
jgi:hypothetical protein